MAIITLTSDWGTKDHYAGAVKGRLLQGLKDVVIVDISHQIPAFDILQAAFILKNAFAGFPGDSIHIVGVNTDASINTPHVAIRYRGHYFIGADNGVFSLIFEEPPSLIVELDIMQDTDFFTFSSRDVFAKAAIHLAEGRDMASLGTVRTTINEKLSFKPVFEGNIIKAKVIYVDSYENVFVNINQEHFRKMVGKHAFHIAFRSSRYKISHISKSYSDVPEGEMIALFSSSGYLEIAMNRGKASSLLGLRMDDPVHIVLD
ncbi:MAG TPA: SAM-dependent chlorinase/fluorinase [Bacteroidales bacterium]|nr:SAM-dependent chlorinase/fluorinase [Bacteroidales bacterium]